jgi:hypothetical protein
MKRNFEKVGEREEALGDLDAKAKALEKVRVLCDATRPTTRVNCFTAHTFVFACTVMLMAAALPLHPAFVSHARLHTHAHPPAHAHTLPHSM